MNEASERWHWRNIQRHQARISSQNGEDGVLLYLLWLLGIDHGRCFEIGASLVNGDLECNTAVLLNAGWQGVIVDKEEINHPWLRRDHVTAENVNGIVDRWNRGEPITVIGIDMDGSDWHVWRAMEARPSIFIVEYNAHRDPEGREVVPYDPDFLWDGSDYFGASGGAMLDLGHAKGYRLAAVVHSLNMFFVRADLLPPDFAEPPISGPIQRHPTDRVNPWVKP